MWTKSVKPQFWLLRVFNGLYPACIVPLLKGCSVIAFSEVKTLLPVFQLMFCQALDAAWFRVRHLLLKWQYNLYYNLYNLKTLFLRDKTSQVPSFKDSNFQKWISHLMFCLEYCRHILLHHLLFLCCVSPCRSYMRLLSLNIVLNRPSACAEKLK